MPVKGEKYPKCLRTNKQESGVCWTEDVSRDGFKKGMFTLPDGLRGQRKLLKITG